LVVEKVPNTNVEVIAADAFQFSTWYAATKEEVLYRTLDNGTGWERVGYFPNEKVSLVCTHAEQAGVLAVANRVGVDDKNWRVHVSWNCGEHWEAAASLPFEIRDLAWISRESVPVLLMATDVGLYELSIEAKDAPPVPVQILVDDAQQDLGFYAVKVIKDIRGAVSVAVVAQETKGVYFSSVGGKPGSFQNIGLAGEDVRVLAVQYDGPRTFLWAGLAAARNVPDKGCCSSEITYGADSNTTWQTHNKNWQGGSCRDIAFQGSTILAATYSAGVLSLDSTKKGAKWFVPDISCNLPLRDKGRLHTVETVAAGPKSDVIMAGGAEGIYRSSDAAHNYESCSNTEFTDTVTLPPMWLFCSGVHQIRVERDA